jgi:hypothetical protein
VNSTPGCGLTKLFRNAILPLDTAVSSWHLSVGRGGSGSAGRAVFGAFGRSGDFARCVVPRGSATFRLRRRMARFPGAGFMAVTIEPIAKRASVSPSTVARVVRGEVKGVPQRSARKARWIYADPMNEITVSLTECLRSIECGRSPQASIENAVLRQRVVVRGTTAPPSGRQPADVWRPELAPTGVSRRTQPTATGQSRTLFSHVFHQSEAIRHREDRVQPG